jgi:hypothetical protein
VVSFTSLNTLEVGGAYIPRPDITPEQELALDAVLRAFGFEPVR